MGFNEPTRRVEIQGLTYACDVPKYSVSVRDKQSRDIKVHYLDAIRRVGSGRQGSKASEGVPHHDRITLDHLPYKGAYLRQ